MIGRIHSIDTFSTLDGPGIRTVVFMQGCHLRCKYCQNPDTWEVKSLSAQEYSPAELMEVIRRSKPYFTASGGGLTFSGGEPLLHDDFIKAVFLLCREENISTAIDTSLYVKPAALLKVLPLTDLVLADIKHINEEKSRCLTGMSNLLNLSNLKLINSHHIPIWIRYVIIPTWTDAVEDVEEMAAFVSQLEAVERIDLLPYHSLGKHKWDLLGYNYELNGVTAPSPEALEQLKDIISAISGKPVYLK